MCNCFAVDQIKLMFVYLRKMWILAFKFQPNTITNGVTSVIVLQRVLTEILKFVFLPSFGAPITSGDLNLLIDDLPFLLSRQKTTSVFFLILSPGDPVL